MRLLPAAALLAACASSTHPPPPPELKFRVVRTPDGWQIPVFHVPAAHGSSGPPVVLMHGLGANRHSLDLDEEHSLARSLARTGRDVWLADSRATGNSQPPADPQDFDFDTLVDDAGRILSAVREATGAPQVDWVGHSMGGMVMIAHLARTENPAVRSLAILGSPVDFSKMQGDVLHAFAAVRGVFSLFGRLHLKAAVWAGRPLIDYDLGPLVVGDLVINPENMSREVFEKVVDTGLDDTAGGVLVQSGGWIECGCWKGRDGFDYLAATSRIQARLLVIAGAADRIAPAAAVRPTFERAASVEKGFLLAGKASGLSADYGHGDLVLGRRAPEEIYPRIAAFLANTQARSAR